MGEDSTFLPFTFCLTAPKCHGSIPIVAGLSNVLMIRPKSYISHNFFSNFPFPVFLFFCVFFCLFKGDANKKLGKSKKNNETYVSGGRRGMGMGGDGAEFTWES